MIDAEDRRFIATWGVRLFGLFAVMISVAGVLGLAVRVFSAAAG